MTLLNLFSTPEQGNSQLFALNSIITTEHINLPMSLSSITMLTWLISPIWGSAFSIIKSFPCSKIPSLRVNSSPYISLDDSFILNGPVSPPNPFYSLKYFNVGNLNCYFKLCILRLWFTFIYIFTQHIDRNYIRTSCFLLLPSNLVTSNTIPHSHSQLVAKNLRKIKYCK